MGRTQAQLAKHIGASQAAVSQALGGLREQDTSILVGPISEALEIDLPMVAQVYLLASKLEGTNPDALVNIRDHMQLIIRSITALSQKDSANGD